MGTPLKGFSEGGDSAVKKHHLVDGICEGPAAK